VRCGAHVVHKFKKRRVAMMKQWMSGSVGIAKRRGVVTALLMVMGGVPVAGATTFTVNTTADGVDANPGDGLCLTASSQCSLRAAIQEANASAGADVITLPASTYTLDIGNIGSQGEEAAAQGDLDITSEIVINGAGADTTIVDGMKKDRVFHIHRGGVATINALTIRNGYANVDGLGGGLSNRGGVVTLNDCNVYRNFGSGFGGGLDNNSFSGEGDTNNAMGTMTINRCTISNNIVMGNGGGVSNNDGILIINDSTIRDNKGGQFADSVQGGGIYNSSSLQLPGSVPARLEVNRSLITGHSVMNDGGGIYHLIGNMTISNSTISGNEAKRNGGGIFIANTLTALSTNRIVHTTITNNSAYKNDTSVPSIGFGGGGLFNGNPSNKSGKVKTYLENSLIAGNGYGGNCYNIGELVKQGNFIVDSSCNNSDEVSVAVVYSAAQIGLGDLADNGGPTLTHALLPTSLAIGAASNALCKSVDQRSFPRPVSGCDAGAFEVEGVDPGAPAQPAPPPSGVSTDGQNVAPQSFPMPYAAIAGQPLHGILNGADANGDPLTYKIVTQPTKGTIGLENPVASDNTIPGSFTYVADASASGADSFTYQACDYLTCSDAATISISISSDAVSEEIGIKLASGTGTSYPITVMTGQALDVFAPTPDYSYPLGAFFFNVTVDSGSGVTASGVEVTIQLPATAIISPDAVIRKLDNKGVWRTLDSIPNPLETTGTINVAAKTITLMLRDNDRFDTDPAVGSISDPVAIAEPRAALADDSASSASASSGGGAMNLLTLAGLLLAAAHRRRSC
jgi:CSLREA domain-containing protein